MEHTALLHLVPALPPSKKSAFHWTTRSTVYAYQIGQFIMDESFFSHAALTKHKYNMCDMLAYNDIQFITPCRRNDD